MTRVAIYARYSDDKQSPNSIDDQVRICRMHADKQGWRVVDQHGVQRCAYSTLVKDGSWVADLPFFIVEPIASGQWRVELVD